jgi:hypothetical protein
MSPRGPDPRFVGKEQIDAFNQPAQPPREREREPAYQPDSETSRAAARSIAPHTLAMRENVLNAIKAAGDRGITRKELESVTGYLTQTLCARLNELEQMKDIRKLKRIIAGEETTIRRQGCAIYIHKRIKVAA